MVTKVPSSRQRFEAKVQRWLEDDPHHIERIYNWLRRKIFQRRPKGIRILAILHWIIKFLIYGSAPFLAHFVYDRITLLQAAAATALLFVLHALSSALNEWSKSKKGTSDLAESEMWVRVGDLVNSVKSDATPPPDRDASVEAALGIIEGYARLVTRSRKGEISVSLAIYEGSSSTNMKIKHRNPGNTRPRGRRLRDLDTVLGHRACQAGDEPRIVADLKRFGREGFRSPTQSQCAYRALCLIPVKSVRTGNSKGFLSIDCVTPHAFDGTVAKKLLVTCEPLIDHISHQI